jgi:hypothetical protein
MNYFMEAIPTSIVFAPLVAPSLSNSGTPKAAEWKADQERDTRHFYRFT